MRWGRWWKRYEREDRVCFGCNDGIYYLFGLIGKLEILEGDEERYE